MLLDVLVPQHLQGDVLAFELAVDCRPVGLGVVAMSLLLADRGKELCVERAVSHLGRQGPAEPCVSKTLQRQPHG
jgi:hypothetical protein